MAKSNLKDKTMKKLLIMTLAMMPLFFNACKETVQPVVKEGSRLDYSFEFFRQVSKDTDANLTVSPYSAAIALNMLQEGAEGHTYAELSKVLNGISYNMLEVDESDSAKVLTANSIWIRDDFKIKNGYRRNCVDRFQAEVASLDFSSPAAPATINDWCSEHTNGLINKMVDNLDLSTVMMLMNALYFKAPWDHFAEGDTRKNVFHGLEGDNSGVEFMHANGSFFYAEKDGFQMVELPYKSSDYVFQVLLPAEGVNLSQVMNLLTEENYRKAMDSMSRVRVSLDMPKFSFETSVNLNAPLKRMGLEDSFTNADLGKITDAGVKIGDVIQKCVMKVAEKGTEAAAVTSISIKLTSCAPSLDVKRMIVNRPFLFLIKSSEADDVLFIGKVVNL